MLEQSILQSIKKLLGIPAEHTEFDTDILIHINTAFMTMKQLGVGPAAGFVVEGEEEQWVTFLAGKPTDFQAVKTFVYLKVRSFFDPPQTSYHTTALENQLQQLEWRLNAAREETDWVDPNPVPIRDEDNVL